MRKVSSTALFFAATIIVGLALVPMLYTSAEEQVRETAKHAEKAQNIEHSNTEVKKTDRVNKEREERAENKENTKSTREGRATGVSEDFLRAVSNVNSEFIESVNLYRNRIEHDADFKTKENTEQNVSRVLQSAGAQRRKISTSTVETHKDGTYISKELTYTASIVRNIDRKAQILKDKVRKVVSQDLNKVIKDVSKRVRREDAKLRAANLSTTKDEQVRAFVNASRDKKLKLIADKLENKAEQITAYTDIVVDSSAQGAARSRALDVVLRSSMDEIELLIEEETGVKVDLSTNSRRVVREIKKETRDFEVQIKALNNRGGLDLYRDTDNDGISDYDETYIYFTNPRDAFTSGSSLTDGERILLGFDVHSTSTERVAVESPLVAGIVTDTIFEVSQISVKTKKPLEIKGRALPNSFVTIYIYSTPIVVTVKADGNGRWEYTLDTQLENGEHSLYVASVNNAGKILAKSKRVPFVKTAEAVDFAPLEATVAVPTPLNVLQDNALAVAIFVFAIFSVIVVLTLGSLRPKSVV